MTDEDHARWTIDGDVLAQIGRTLEAQTLEVEVRMPRELADAAVAAWQRDDSETKPKEESAEQLSSRLRAASLALIGCSVEERGWLDGDDVVVQLHAWFIGDALSAADQDGLLDGVHPPR